MKKRRCCRCVLHLWSWVCWKTSGVPKSTRWKKALLLKKKKKAYSLCNLKTPRAQLMDNKLMHPFLIQNVKTLMYKTVTLWCECKCEWSHLEQIWPNWAQLLHKLLQSLLSLHRTVLRSVTAQGHCLRQCGCSLLWIRYIILGPEKVQLLMLWRSLPHGSPRSWSVSHVSPCVRCVKGLAESLAGRQHLILQPFIFSYNSHI